MRPLARTKTSSSPLGIRGHPVRTPGAWHSALHREGEDRAAYPQGGRRPRSQKGKAMRHYKPERIFIERDVADTPIVANVRRNAPSVPVETIESADELLERARRWTPSIAQGKRVLVLARHRGRFFKPCPAGTTKEGAAPNACCNYFVVNYASNCHMECSYCYLQAYLNLPYMVVYANHEDLLAELSQVFSSNLQARFRVGTGELADSLALDPLTEYSRPLVEFFSSWPNAILEFKTKSDCVDLLPGLDHRGRTIVSFSINPFVVQRAEEHKTASTECRLAAAERCAKAGYPIVFHFDPMVHYSSWETDYRALVEEIFRRIPPASIPFVSLGALRMTPRLKETIRERFPDSPLPLGELVPCQDGKLRYFKPLRVEMLSKMRSWIAQASPQTQVYTCMENADVYRRVFQESPQSDRALGDQLLSFSVD